MGLWIIYTLSILTLLQQSSCYDDPTARILDVGVVPWKPVPAYHTGVSPHYINFAVNPNSNFHLAQVAAHNGHLMQQIKGFTPPVTQYRNPYPVFQAAQQYPHHHHHYVLPKENTQKIQTSASNIAQTILPSNYLKPAYITGKPAFNLKPEYITKPEFYNGIQTTYGKYPHIPSFKQMPPIKDAMASLFQEPSYKGLVLTHTPQQFQNHGSLYSYKQQHTLKDKPVGSFSFPNEGLSSLTYFGPASHLIRGDKQSVPKPQPTVYFPSEVGNNSKNVNQFFQPARNTFQNQPNYQSVQPVRYESSTPNYFGQTSIKISPSQSFELTYSRAPDGKETISSTTVAPLPSKTEVTPSSQTVQPIKSQALPPIPASVLTPFFHQMHQEQNSNYNTVSSLEKDKFVNNEYSKHLVPPPYIHTESSTFRTTPHAPTKRPTLFQEEANALNILNKYNIPVISPLQDANKFKYESNVRSPTVIPLNYSLSSIVAFPTNAPQQTPLSIEPTGVLSTVDSFTNNYNNYNFFDNNQNIKYFGNRPHENQGRIPQNQNFDGEHTFFTIDDALTPQPGNQASVSPTSIFGNIQTQLQVQENPEVIINEHPSTLTTNPPRIVMQTSEYKTTTTTAAPVLPLSTTPSTPTAPSSSVDPYGSRNRFRGKPRRRRPKPSTTDEPLKEESDVNQHETVRERPLSSTSTTERTVHRNRINNRGRISNRPVHSVTSTDPTLRIIQRNSLKNRFTAPIENMQDRHPTELFTTTAIEYHPPSFKPTQPAVEDMENQEEEAQPSTTAISHEHEASLAVEPLENYNIVSNTPEETTLPGVKLEAISEEPVNPQVNSNLDSSLTLSHTPPLSTEQVVLNQTPQQVLSEPTKSSDDFEPHVSHRQRYRYKIKSTPQSAPEPSVEPIVSEESASAQPSPPSPSSTSSENTKTVTRLRPVNKYRSQDRPRFSVKDYRQRIKTHSTTTTSTESPFVSSTTAGYRNRHRFPTRKRLLPSLRTRGSTTEKPQEPENNDVPIGESNNEETHSNSNAALPLATSTSTTSSQSSSSRRVSFRRGGYNRYRSTTSTTEAPASLEEEERKPVRQRTRDRYNQRTHAPASSTESLPQTHQLNLSPEDLNNIAVETEQPSSTAENKPESAIMKISKTDHSSKQSEEEAADVEPLFSEDMNGSPSEHSERVAQLTLSGSSNKFSNLNKNTLSRRIPGYFTLATEDPILPIEAFFPNVKSKSNLNR